MSGNEVLAALICMAGGFTGGIVGVGGGVLFVPALTIFIGINQVESESTSLLMIVIVALVVALTVQHDRASRREADLRARLSTLNQENSQMNKRLKTAPRKARRLQVDSQRRQEGR